MNERLLSAALRDRAPRAPRSRRPDPSQLLVSGAAGLVVCGMLWAQIAPWAGPEAWLVPATLLMLGATLALRYRWFGWYAGALVAPMVLIVVLASGVTIPVPWFIYDALRPPQTTVETPAQVAPTAAPIEAPYVDTGTGGDVQVAPTFAPEGKEQPPAIPVATPAPPANVGGKEQIAPAVQSAPAPAPPENVGGKAQEPPQAAPASFGGKDVAPPPVAVQSAPEPAFGGKDTSEPARVGGKEQP